MKEKKHSNELSIYFISLVLFVIVRICSSMGLLDFLTGWWGEIFSSVLIQIVILFGMPFLLTLFINKTKPKNIFLSTGFKKISFKSILICFVIGVLLYIVNIYVSTLFNGILSLFGYHSPATQGVGVVVNTIPKFLLYVGLVAVLPAFCEEFLHRGLLLQGIKKKGGIACALIISSVLFGLTHLNIQQFFYATVLGFFMGSMVIFTKSIYPAMIVHFVNNFISCYITFAENNNLPGKNITGIFSNLVEELNIGFALLLIAVLIFSILFVLMLLIIALYNQSVKYRAKKLMLTLKENPESIQNEMLEFSEKEFNSLSSEFKPVIIDNTTDFATMFKYLYPTDDKTFKKISFNNKIFLFASLFLGIVVTIITFVWGLM